MDNRKIVSTFLFSSLPEAPAHGPACESHRRTHWKQGLLIPSFLNPPPWQKQKQKSRIRDARFTRSEGATENKAGAGGLLIESMQAVGSTLLAFANDTGNFELAELTDRTPSSFTRLRDGELPGLAARYLSAARQWSTGLADFGLTEESITDLEANKGRYEEWAQAPANAISDAKGKTSDLKTGFADVGTLLRDKVDPLVRGLVKRFPDLWRDYKEARIIRRNPVVSKPEAQRA
ncbi:MAG: hypothetical protein EOO12_09475 [Chitinophagaceae bacterium]|nr:MAG: hypothetical protein EOO12_09475 [Chitinophagaceae bacterium]